MQREAQQRMEREAQKMAPQIKKDSPSYDPEEGCDDDQQQQKQQGQGQSKKQQDAKSVKECQCLQDMECVQHRMISNANHIVEAFSSAFSNALSRELENFQGKLTEMLAQQKEVMLQQQQQRGQAQAPQCQGQGQGPQQVPFLQQGKQASQQQQVPYQQQQDLTGAPSTVVIAGHRPPSTLVMPPNHQMMKSTPVPLVDTVAMAEGIMDDPSAWDDIFDSDSDSLEDDEDQMFLDGEDDSSAPPELRQPFPKKKKVNFMFSDDDPMTSTEQGPFELR